jgi:hypothetical protein
VQTSIAKDRDDWAADLALVQKLEIARRGSFVEKRRRDTNGKWKYYQAWEWEDSDCVKNYKPSLEEMADHVDDFCHCFLTLQRQAEWNDYITVDQLTYFRKDLEKKRNKLEKLVDRLDMETELLVALITSAQ